MPDTDVSWIYSQEQPRAAASEVTGLQHLRLTAVPPPHRFEVRRGGCVLLRGELNSTSGSLDEGMGMHVCFYLQLEVDMLTRDDRPVSGRGVLSPPVPASLSFP
jgi:hypothetical protein